jgi:hypothetical protein
MAWHVANKSLQVTFAPPPIFAAAKTDVAANAPELRRYTAIRISELIFEAYI